MGKEQKPNIEGNGSKESPFVTHASDQVTSAAIQAIIIDGIFGKGTYNPNGRRNYFYSVRGEPGNNDLCEHIVDVGGKKASVWFDLYLVSRLVNNSALKKVKGDVISPISIATQNVTQPAPPPILQEPSVASPASKDLIRINAKSEIEACEKIHLHLAPHFEQGWIVDKAFALIGGWKNQYILKRGMDTRALDFDISPSLPNFSNTLIFTMSSMTLGTPGALEKLKELNQSSNSEKPKTKEHPAWMGCLVWIIIGVVFILWILSK